MDRSDLYAQAAFDVAAAEGTLPLVEDEMFRFNQALSGSDELRTKLSDPQLPAATRSQIVEDLLGRQATATTTSLVSMIVANGRIGDFGDIVGKLLERSAAESNKKVAEVRSAVDLDADQRQRLAAALESATGSQVELKVIVDPSVKGGAVTTIGDTVIDGSVATRLSALRESMA